MHANLAAFQQALLPNYGKNSNSERRFDRMAANPGIVILRRSTVEFRPVCVPFWLLLALDLLELIENESRFVHWGVEVSTS